MRDGITLRGDIYRPEAAGEYPVLLQRTPYNKELWPITAMTLDPIRAAEAGFAVLIQDVRSRWASEGDVFFPYKHEEQDGYDSIDWASQQSFFQRKSWLLWPVLYGWHFLVSSGIWAYRTRCDFAHHCA